MLTATVPTPSPKLTAEFGLGDDVVVDPVLVSVGWLVGVVKVVVEPARTSPARAHGVVVSPCAVMDAYTDGSAVE